MNPGNFFGELKRRNVYKVAVAYIVGGWALSQLWLFWIAPLIGAALAGIAYRCVSREGTRA